MTSHADSNRPPLLLALSGGGYRAVLFHVGALWRLNEIGELRALTHVSSVSGGSIVAGILAARWDQLAFDSSGIARRFGEQIVEPLLRLTDHSLDWPAILLGVLPFASAAGVIARSYRRHLVGDKTIGDLPVRPKFVFNATNLQTGAGWSFEREGMGDSSVGFVRDGSVPIATAIAASSAFPPFLSPLKLSLGRAGWEPPRQSSWMTPYSDLALQVRPIPRDKLQGFRKRVYLIDGGVADNLGLAALWKTEGELLISDGGAVSAHCVSPHMNWVGQLRRVLSLIHDQPSRLRADTAISRFAEHDQRGTKSVTQSPRGDGAYWKMHWPPESHTDVPVVALDEAKIRKLSEIPTRLLAMNEDTKLRLINWGYVAANRSLPYLARLWLPRGASVFKEELPYRA